ncbi:TorF family putative porin [Thiogranum longum]|jgi:uncharacterized protein (TIGR02001 family)
MKFSKTILASALLAAAGVAQAELSANIAAQSNYYFRGVTQTDDKAAISGGLDWGADSGLYLGTWMSNVDFGGKEDVEVDLYGGFGGDIGDTGLGYDLSVWYYWYPGAGGDAQGGDLDYTEVSGSLSFGMLTGTVNYTIDSENDDDGPFVDGDLYYNASIDLPIDYEGFGVSAFIGYYDFTDDGKKNVGDLSYTHWGIGVSKDAGEFGSFSLNYEQTDGDEDDGVATDENPNFWIGWAKDF